MKIFFQCLRLRHLALLDWKFLKIDTLRAKDDPRKIESVFHGGGSTPASPTLPVVRVVLLHKRAFVQSFMSRSVYV